MTNQQQLEYLHVPKLGNVAIYKRRATQEKAEQKQTPPHNLICLAHELGYADSQIMLFEQDSGIPGNTPIDERVGLASILQAIASGAIQAILVADETRLFRDAKPDQLKMFISVCREYHAIVYTPVATYDFTNPQHVKLFRFNCQPAFEVLKEAYKVRPRTRSKDNGS